MTENLFLPTSKHKRRVYASHLPLHIIRLSPTSDPSSTCTSTSFKTMTDLNKFSLLPLSSPFTGYATYATFWYQPQYPLLENTQRPVRPNVVPTDARSVPTSPNLRNLPAHPQEINSPSPAKSLANPLWLFTTLNAPNANSKMSARLRIPSTHASLEPNQISNSIRKVSQSSITSTPMATPSKTFLFWA